MRARSPLALTLVLAIGAGARSLPRASAAPTKGVASASASASSAPKGPEAKKLAKQHFDRGVKAFDAHDYASALAEFEEAYGAVPAWALLYNIGSCHYELKAYAKALDAFDRYLAEGGAKVPADKRAKVEALRDDCRAHVGSIRVRVDVDGADVTIDGESVGASPLERPVVVDAGTHVVSASVSPSRTARRELDVRAGAEPIEVRLELAPKPVAPPPPPEPPRTRTSPLVYGGFGAAVVGGVVGTTFGLLAFGKRSDLSAECSPDKLCPHSAQGDLDAMKRDATISTIGFGVGLAGVAVGVWGLFHPSAEESAQKPPSARIEPFVGLGTLGVRGSF